MSYVVLEFCGIHTMEPEDELCALFRWRERDKVLPIWISRYDGGRVRAILQGESSMRPNPLELLLEVFSAQGGVESVQIAHHFEGAFMASVTSGEGETYDCRPTEAILLSEHFGQPILFDEDILAHTAVYLSDADLEEYFGMRFEDAGAPPCEGAAQEAQDSGESEGEAAQSDADFAAMMESLGVSEEDFFLGEEEGGQDNGGEKGEGRVEN